MYNIYSSHGRCFTQATQMKNTRGLLEIIDKKTLDPSADPMMFTVWKWLRTQEVVQKEMSNLVIYS